MPKTKILTAFGKYNDSDLEQKAELIADSLNENAGFPNPVPSLEDLTAAISAFGTAIIKAKEGSTKERMDRDAKRHILIAQLDKLALYVQLTGDGNDALLASSGFSLNKTPSPVGILEKPKNFTIKPDNVGMIKVSCKAIRGAKSYQYEFRNTNDENWNVNVHTQCNLLLTGLQSGKQYQFRMAGVGTATDRVYSDVLNSFVL